MSALQLNPQGFWVSDFFSPLLFSPQHNACFLTLSVCACVFECVRLSTEESTRWVCFPSELVNRSRAAFMCRVHYHGDGCDGNPAAAAAEFDRQQLAATIAPPSSLPCDTLFVFFPLLWPPPVPGLTCPHSSSPTPMNTHHNHWSMVSAVQENGFPPNWTMMIWGGEHKMIFRKGERIKTDSLRARVSHATSSGS